MSFQFSPSKSNFYRELKSEGSDVVMCIPQYYSNNPISSHLYNNTRKVYEMSIAVSAPIVKSIARIAAASIKRFKGITGHNLPIENGVLTLRNKAVTGGKYYNSDGSYEENGYNNMESPCHVLVELWIPGILVTNGILTLDIRIKKCVFIQAGKEAKVRLSFPGERVAIPPHFMCIFNQSNPEDRTCPICREVIDSDLTMTKCFHFFHGACMLQYTGEKCPVCRSDM